MSRAMAKLVQITQITIWCITGINYVAMVGLPIPYDPCIEESWFITLLTMVVVGDTSILNDLMGL